MVFASPASQVAAVVHSRLTTALVAVLTTTHLITLAFLSVQILTFPTPQSANLAPTTASLACQRPPAPLAPLLTCSTRQPVSLRVLELLRST